MKIRSSVALLCLTASAFANPTGLNNIPTADTPTQGDYVFQTYSTFGQDRKQDFNLGFKTGFDFKPFKLEVGADERYVPGTSGPATVQAKVTYSFGEGLPSLAVGTANTAFTAPERVRSGGIFGYTVLTQDLGFFRVHAGCALQNEEGQPFIGVSKVFRIHTKKPAARDGKATVARDGKTTADDKTEEVTRDLFILRADAIQQQNRTWVSSAGVLVPICKYIVFETWGNFPSDGTSASVTVKGDFVFHF